MAATSFTGANLVWQKVNLALSTQGSAGVSGAASPASVNAFRALKLQLATQEGNPDLQFFPFSEADVDITASGFTGPTGAFTLYGAWVKKSETGTGVSFLEIRNQINTTYGTGATGVLVSIRSSGPGDETAFTAPGGVRFTQTTGSALVAATTINGATSVTGDTNSVHGFLIIAA